MFYRAVAATCPGNDKAYNSNNIYLNTKYITSEIKSSEVLLRQKNEQQGLQFYAIAEGFGAADYTDEASLIAIKKLLNTQRKAANVEISDNYDEAADAVYSYLEDFVKDAQEAVTAKAAEFPESKIYSSVAAVGFYATAAITCNLGNTRIYLYRKGHLSQLTEDHNQAQVMQKNGVIAADKVASHPKRNKLTQYLGIFPDGKQPEPYYSEVEVRHGDIFVICSSTFCSNVDDDSICDIIRESKSLSQIAEKLMSAAAENGFADDTSILVVRADSHEKSAAAAGAKAAGAAGNAAAAGKKAGAVAGGTAAAAGAGSKSRAEASNESFTDKLKRILGIGADSENEKMWPALLMFGGCILVVIILVILGVKIYNASKSTLPAGNNTNPPSAIVGTPLLESPSGDIPTASDSTGSITATPVITPSDMPTDVPTETPTETPATQQPTQNVTPVPPTQPPVTDTPTPPTATPTEEPPATETPTEIPTETPPTEAPATETPTTEPTEQPTPTQTEETPPAEETASPSPDDATPPAETDPTGGEESPSTGEP